VGPGLPLTPSGPAPHAPRHAAFACALALLGAALGAGDAAAEETGVRHELTASVAAGSPASGAGEPAGVTVTVRIVDIAPDSRFAALVSTDFAAPGPRVIWADAKCHRDRGWPRVWLLAVDGPAISARPRHIGQRIPDDEIIVQKQLDGPGEPVTTLAMAARTTRSRLGVRLTLTLRPCRLDAAP
jgi:hypothetical protein